MRVRRKALFALGVLFLLAAIGLPDVPAFAIWQSPGRQSLSALTLWCHSLQARMLVAVFHLAARRCTAASTLDDLALLVFVCGLLLIVLAVFAGRRGRSADAAES